MTTEQLQAEEARCIAKIEARADRLMREDPRLARSIAIGRAIESLPKCAANYLQARSHLTMAGIRPLPMK
jgi:hypothetical protein